jgi:Ca2+-binding EF-hand superfamily protein
MLFAIGAASSAIDLLSSLTQGPSTSSSKTGIVPVGSNAFSVADTPATPAPTPPSPSGPTTGPSTPASFNTLLAAQTQSQSNPTSRSAALQDLFSQIDANGDGQISKSEFENALGAGGTNLKMADDVFAKMDKNGDGSISMDEMNQSLQGAGRHHHQHRAGGGGGKGAGGADSLAQALQGATSSTATNADGSTTTTLTYADGTKITMTQPATSSGSTPPANGNAAASYNFTERLIERQAHAIAANAQSSLSMSV